jgi:hypothetical protein
MQPAENLELLPGADDMLPLQVRWLALAGNPAAVALDGDRM